MKLISPGNLRAPQALLANGKQCGAGEDLLKKYIISRAGALAGEHMSGRVCHQYSCLWMYVWMFTNVWLRSQMCVDCGYSARVCFGGGAASASSHENSPCHRQYITTVTGPDNDAGPARLLAFWYAGRRERVLEERPTGMTGGGCQWTGSVHSPPLVVPRGNSQIVTWRRG